jgi:hypothetical protein
MASLPLALSNSLRTYVRPSGHIRQCKMADWVDQRWEAGIWPGAAALHRRPMPQTLFSLENEVDREGVNFASAGQGEQP